MSELTLEGVRSGYGPIEIVHGVSLHVEPGETVALLGPNGAGKTTLLMAISGLLRPTGGAIYFRGKRTDSMDAERLVSAGMAHVPQGRRVFPAFTTRRNLEIGAFSRKDRAAIAREVDGWLERFPILKARANHPAGLLSGGEQQLLALCRALMSRPKLLLLDEPSLGLAPIMVRTMLELLKDLRDDAMTMLLVEQNIKVALEVASRVYVMSVGTIQMAASVSSLAEADLIALAYLGGT